VKKFFLILPILTLFSLHPASASFFVGNNNYVQDSNAGDTSLAGAPPPYFFSYIGDVSGVLTNGDAPVIGIVIKGGLPNDCSSNWIQNVYYGAQADLSDSQDQYAQDPTSHALDLGNGYILYYVPANSISYDGINKFWGTDLFCPSFDSLTGFQYPNDGVQLGTGNFMNYGSAMNTLNAIGGISGDLTTLASDASANLPGGGYTPPPPSGPSMAIAFPTSTAATLTADIGSQIGDPGTLKIIALSAGTYLAFYVIRQIIALMPKKKRRD
jgi:hypothetical protein